MSASYQHIALADAVPGMILSDDVLDHHGQVLLPQGAVLTEAMLAALARHAIDMLAVLSEALSAEQEESELAARRVRLDQLFRKSGEEGPDRALRTLVERFLLGAQP